MQNRPKTDQRIHWMKYAKTTKMKTVTKTKYME